ncbi:MAG TPA: CocE/NonD family hydrolase [Pseudonocardiaceae bacterium]|jgi:predicted acyl esterase|nr:CocE/NonD family hydrolase [Pseudonocardiaceae bacterium]
MKFEVTSDVRVPMRDGTMLSTSIWRPGTDEPVPALLMRTPYGKEMLGALGGSSPNFFTGCS